MYVPGSIFKSSPTPNGPCLDTTTTTTTCLLQFTLTCGQDAELVYLPDVASTSEINI